MGDWWHNSVISTLEGILIVGAFLTAIGIGVKRLYKMARGVEQILENNEHQKKAHADISMNLMAHIEKEERQDHVRDIKIQELIDTVQEISRETRPNGGSSMKDVLNHTAERIGDIHGRVLVLEEWKRNETTR